MEKCTSSRKFLWQAGVILLVGLFMAPGIVLAGEWWKAEPEDETPSAYYDSILYSEIAPRLKEIETNSARIKVDVIGQSAGGRSLFLVTLAEPGTLKRLDGFKAIRKMMLRDPEKALKMIEESGGFKAPVFINAGIHGDEYPAVDAAIKLIETLAYENTPEVQDILENIILLVNVVQNPDGRVLGIRGNANHMDINRDFATQSQPETRATVDLVAQWNPLVFLDLHGFMDPMLIEPCTAPHNPNYEYDLYLKWSFYQAIAMEDELMAQMGLETQIPYRDLEGGWDDWAPIYAAMYPIHHGSYGHTLETPYEDEDGVNAHFWAVWGALKFIAANREAMILDQMEIYKRGVLEWPQVLIPEYLLDETQYEQYNELTVTEFPAGYIIPADIPFQISSHQAARLIDFLLFNGVEVEMANNAFTYNQVTYPEGTYIVWMAQPKRGLAKAILEDGLDLSSISGLTFYSPPSVWSHPLLWGAHRAVMGEKVEIDTRKIIKARRPRGSMESGVAKAYAFSLTSIASFQAVNHLLTLNIPLSRTAGSFEDSGRTFGAGTVIFPERPLLAALLANKYALKISSLSQPPTDTIPMREQRIAVYGDAGVNHALKTLGFEFDAVGINDLDTGAIEQYDVFVNRDLAWNDLSEAGRAAMASWFEAGGDYIGLGYRGGAVQFAVEAGLAEVQFGFTPGNGIVKIDFESLDAVAAGFPEQGYAFVYRSVWFTSWPKEMQVSARIDDGADFLVSGYWQDWQNSSAAGMPVVLHNSEGIADVTLIGINNTFRGHPEDSFRILGNAIYAGLD